ncbi:hypothetical protein LTS18_001312, partial [Coniosporium uncinatum]
KRKASLETADTVNNSDPNPSKRVVSSKLTNNLKAAQAPTPTETVSMDSDDDFNSPQSSEDDFMGEADSFGEDNSDIEVEDDDAGFSQDKVLKAGRKPYEVDFKVYSPQDIQAYQDKQIADVSSIIGQPPESTAILLRHARWNKERLIESYMDKMDEVMESAGLGEDDGKAARIKKVKGFMCDICCEDNANLSTFAM